MEETRPLHYSCGIDWMGRIKEGLHGVLDSGSNYCFLNVKHAEDLFGWRMAGKGLRLKKPAGQKAYGPFYPAFTLKIRNRFHERFREFHLPSTKLNKEPDGVYSARGRTYITEMSEGLSLVLGKAWIDNTAFPVREIIEYEDIIEFTPYSLKKTI